MYQDAIRQGPSSPDDSPERRANKRKETGSDKHKWGQDASETFIKMTDVQKSRALAQQIDEMTVAEQAAMFAKLCEVVDEKVMAEAIVDAFGKADSSHFADLINDTPRASWRRWAK